MIRRLIATLVAFVFVTLASTGLAFAAVDVNSADQTQLQTIDGIGPAISAKIVAERKNGGYKDWDDLIKRVPGIGDKNSAKFSSGGLTVGGAMKPETRLDPSLMKRTNQAPTAAVAKAPSTQAPAAPPAPAKALPTPRATDTGPTVAPAPPAVAKAPAATAKAEAPAPAEPTGAKAKTKNDRAVKEDAASTATVEAPAAPAEAKARKTRTKKGDPAETNEATPKK